MWRFLLSRLLSAIPTLLAIVTLAFVLLRAAPGGPFDAEKELTPEVKASIEHAYHLDEPLPKQYLRYLGQLARGDLGPSFQYLDNSVNKYIAEGFPVDLRIGGLALLLACLIGIPLGARAAWRRGGVIDRLATAVSLVGVSIPVYVTAPLLILIFAVTLQWLPAGDWGAGSWRNLILPVLALSSPYIAYVTRIMRASFIEVLEQPYIRTARAKGLSTQDILFGHALRPALMPLAAFLGPAIVGAITGSIVVETTFGLPGIGRSFVDGAFNRDYTLVMGVTILYGVLIIFANLLADVCQALLDPTDQVAMNQPLPKISVWILAMLLLSALLGPLLSPYDYFTPDWDHTNLSPGLSSHLLGTDSLGRDLLVRLLWSARISLLVALAASLISLTIGVAWGVAAGYLGGRTDALMMRIVDVLYSVPFTPFVIVLTVVFGRNLLLLFIAIGAVSWLDIARIVRGQTLALRHREFVVAAEIAGVSPSRIMRRHIVPNLMGIVIVYLTLTIPTVILTEAFLSYLGLGAQAPLTSLGVMLAEGAAQMRARPLLLIMPAVVLILLVYCCNRIGDRLRDRYAR